MKYLSQTQIKEAIWIFLIAVAFGLIVNLFHPHKIQVTAKRPSLHFAPDTILAQDLPGVSISEDCAGQVENSDTINEPLLITTDQVIQLQSSGQAMLFDARTRQEFLKAHIPGAENIPYKIFLNT